MPELPEVEAARRAIEEHCIGRRITKSIVADDPKVIDGLSPSAFEAAIIGKTIVASHRKGKNMWLQLDSPPFPTFQFGMTGAVYIKGVAITKYKRSVVKDSDEWPSKYSKLFVELDDGLEFSFTDKRRFAKVRLLENPISVPPISALGPDALLEPMTLDGFWNSTRKKNIGIKALLLDQSYISGIGNWMADEVLYHARIHPQQSASSISKENCSTLLKTIDEVTKFAVGVNADSLLFPVEWLFHFRWGKKLGKINGKKIEFINAGGRTTAFVPELQKLTDNQAVKEAGKPSEDNLDANAVEDDDSVEGQSRKANVAKERRASKSKKLSKKFLSPSIEDSDYDEVKDKDAAESNNKTVKKISRALKPSNRKSSPSVDNNADGIDADDKSSKKPRGAVNSPKRNKTESNVKNDTGKGRKPTIGKKTPAKRKHKDSRDELSSSSESGDDEYVGKVVSKARKEKDAEGGTSSKKMAASGRNLKQQKKK